EYITQIAKFDRSKSIPDVIESYHNFHVILKNLELTTFSCGHGAIGDLDAELVPVVTRELLQDSRYATIVQDVVVILTCMPALNAIITKAKIVLRLSLREGFEVKVSKALHHGKLVVATRPGGSSLQIEHGNSGFLVDVGDTEAVASHLFDLYTNHDLYARMSKQAKASVSDEVGTVYLI
ncbi:hypothetical protein HOY82DRAFT_468769, partial [Tuber indicum]